MQSHIPDDLGHEVARLAAGLNLDLDTAVRQALETWIRQYRTATQQRLPDQPLLRTEAVEPACELPRTSPTIVSAVIHAQRMPDGLDLR